VKTSRHGQNLIKLTRLGAVNFYLVREEDGLTVVDTGIGGSAKGILVAAQAAGAPIRRITVTHGHGDHTGSLDALITLAPDAEVILPAREARLMRDDRASLPGEPKAPPGGSPFAAGAIPRRHATASREVQPGDRIGSLEVVDAAGHSPGQVALLDARDRTLIAADAFANLGGLYVTSQVNPRFPLPALSSWDRPTALRSARALRALNPSRLAVGHGAVIEDPSASMDRAISSASR